MIPSGMATRRPKTKEAEVSLLTALRSKVLNLPWSIHSEISPSCVNYYIYLPMGVTPWGGFSLKESMSHRNKHKFRTKPDEG